MPYVYFVADADRRFVKIGKTNNLEHRLSSLRSGSPLYLHVEYSIYSHDDRYAHLLEDALHQHFAEHWKHSEWFDFHTSISAFIDHHKRDGSFELTWPQVSCRQFRRDISGACFTKNEVMAQLRASAVARSART